MNSQKNLKHKYKKPRPVSLQATRRAKLSEHDAREAAAEAFKITVAPGPEREHVTKLAHTAALPVVVNELSAMLIQFAQGLSHAMSLLPVELQARVLAEGGLKRPDAGPVVLPDAPAVQVVPGP